MSKLIIKALDLIEALAASDGPRGVTELSQELSLPKSGVHRLLHTLCSRGYVQQTSDSDKYQLSLKLWQLGCVVFSKMEIKNVAEPYMQKLCNEAREDVFLSIVDGRHVIYVHRVDSAQIIKVTYGGSNPAHCSSTGKAILAWQSEEKIDHALAGAKSYTTTTIFRKNDFMEELKRIREQGFSINNSEWRESIRGVAAPIFTHTGEVSASIGISGPAYRLELHMLESLGNLVKRTAADISRELGWLGDVPGNESG